VQASAAHRRGGTHTWYKILDDRLADAFRHRLMSMSTRATIPRPDRAATTRRVLLAGALLAVSAAVWAQPAPFEYRLSFPSPEHRWMQVEARFGGLPPGTAEIRMSRTSPGRYALHEFAKNVFDEQVADGAGRLLVAMRPNLHQWNVQGHDGSVVMRYKVYGDRVDGTYLGVDASHAHMNMPATLMFVRGQLDRPARVTFVRPEGRDWRVATQLFPTPDPFVFTAPNIHYLMDSPAEFSGFTLRTFTVDDGAGQDSRPATVRIALHHDGTEADADAFARDVEKIVREAIGVFGELPRFDGGTYTFLCDYLPWADGDGMEHRNSTVLASRGALRNPGQREALLGTVSHEFFHAWNMERLRARGVEPFNYEEATVSDELWFGEGFTSYFDSLMLARAGLMTPEALLSDLAASVNTVALSPGRQFRSAVDMSRLAPFVDAAASIDRTAWPNLFISYYTYGSAIALGLDLSLRERSDGKATLDDYMRALWRRFGRSGGAAPGVVATPYTIRDLEAVLGEIAGDAAFANDFFRRFVEGREVVDYARLLARAGLVMRKRAAGAAWLGDVRLQVGAGGARVTGLVPFDSPLYRAGVAQDDQVISLDGVDLKQQSQIADVLGRRKPGDAVSIVFVRRSGERVETTVQVAEDPRVEIVLAEAAGGTVSAAERRFRESWLGSRR
jgi:predicted metalloprotease with PDZ domain